MNARIRRFACLPLIPLIAVSAVAQEAMSPEQAYEAARNQLGVLTYCEAQDFIDGEAVAAQQRLLSLLPTGDEAAGKTAETKGRNGNIVAAGEDIALAHAAEEQKTEVAVLCGTMAEMVIKAVAQLPPG